MDELREMLQHTIMDIIQNVFVSKIELPKTSPETAQKSLITNMALKYLDNLDLQVRKQRPFAIPKYFTGSTQSYATEFTTIMTNFNNQVGQLFESLVTEIKQTKRIIANLDQQEKAKKSTQELIETPPSPVLNRQHIQKSVINHDNDGPSSSGWTFSKYSKNTIPAQPDNLLNESFFQSNQSVNYTTPPHVSNNLPIIHHRRIPEWAKERNQDK